MRSQLSVIVCSVAVTSVSPSVGQDSEEWQLFVDPSRKATLITDQPRTGAATVRFDGPPTELPGQIVLTRAGFSVEKGKVFAANFAARAEQPRVLFVALSQGHPPWQPLALMNRLSISTEWRTYQVLFHPEETDAKAQLGFQLGSSNAAVQIADVTFGLVDSEFLDDAAMRFPPGVWQASTSPDSHAQIADTGPNSFRVEMGDVASLEEWHVNVWTGGFPLQANIRYELQFRVRSDEERVIGVGVSENHPPWQTLGLRAPVVVTPEWRERTLEFISPRTDLNAKLFVLLGGSEIPVEISDVRLRLATNDGSVGVLWRVGVMLAILVAATGAGYYLWHRPSAVDDHFKAVEKGKQAD